MEFVTAALHNGDDIFLKIYANEVLNIHLINLTNMVDTTGLIDAIAQMHVNDLSGMFLSGTRRSCLYPMESCQW